MAVDRATGITVGIRFDANDLRDLQTQLGAGFAEAITAAIQRATVAAQSLNATGGGSVRTAVAAVPGLLGIPRPVGVLDVTSNPQMAAQEALRVAQAEQREQERAVREAAQAHRTHRQEVLTRAQMRTRANALIAGARDAAANLTVAAPQGYVNAAIRRLEQAAQTGDRADFYQATEDLRGAQEVMEGPSQQAAEADRARTEQRQEALQRRRLVRRYQAQIEAAEARVTELGHRVRPGYVNARIRDLRAAIASGDALDLDRASEDLRGAQAVMEEGATPLRHYDSHVLEYRDEEHRRALHQQEQREELQRARFSSPYGDRTAGQAQRLIEEARRVAVAVTPAVVGVVDQMQRHAAAGDETAARMLSLQHGREFDTLEDQVRRAGRVGKLTRAGLVYGANRFITGLGSAASGMLTQDPLMSNMGGQQVLGLASSGLHGLSGVLAARAVAGGPGAFGAGVGAVATALVGAAVDTISNVAQKGSALRADANTRVGAYLTTLGTLLGPVGQPLLSDLTSTVPRDAAVAAGAIGGLQKDKRVWGLYQALGGTADTAIADARRTQGLSVWGQGAEMLRQVREEQRMLRFVDAAAGKGRSGEQILGALAAGMGGMRGDEDLLYALGYRAKDYGVSGKGYGSLLASATRGGAGALGLPIAGLLGRAGDAMGLGPEGKDAFYGKFANLSERFTAMGAGPFAGMQLGQAAAAFAGAGLPDVRVQKLLEGHAADVQGARAPFESAAAALRKGYIQFRAAKLAGGDLSKAMDIMSDTSPLDVQQGISGLSPSLGAFNLAAQGVSGGQRDRLLAGDRSALPAEEFGVPFWSVLKNVPGARTKARTLAMRSSQSELEELQGITQDINDLAESISRAADKIGILGRIFGAGDSGGP